MERAILQADKRQELGTRASRRLRLDGRVPAVLYGHQRDPVHLTVGLKELEHVLHSGTRMVDVEIGGTVEPALMKDLQYDAMGDDILHLDLARVSLDEKVQVTIPVELHGTPKGVNLGGTLDHVIQDIEVECLAGSIPERILIEVADLDIGDTVHVRELPAPEGVVFTLDGNNPVVTIHPPVAAEVEEGEEGLIDMHTEPEVIGRMQDADEDQEG